MRLLATKFSLLILALVSLSTMGQSARAQNAAGLDRVEKYMKFGHPAAKFDLSFPGKDGGYTFAHVPVRVKKGDSTVIENHVFLIDLATVNGGVFIPPDTVNMAKDYQTFDLVWDDKHTVHAELAPSKAKADFKKIDSTFLGVLGYAFFRQYTTVFDFKKNVLTLYPLYSNIVIGEKDTNVIDLTYHDDAVLTYCHCPYPTMWLDASAPPLKPGRVHVGFAEPRSLVFTPALDDRTEKKLENEMKEDPLTGQRPKVGIKVASFKIGNAEIASREPKRNVQTLPPAFKDLSITIMGTIGTDVMRTFEGIIIDPTNSRIVFVK